MAEDALAENAAILAGFAEQGADLTRERDVEFQHLLPDEAAANAFAECARSLGFRADVHGPDEEDLEEGFTEWDVVCTLSMVATPEAVTEAESRLGDLAAEFDGTADGWGFFA